IDLPSDRDAVLTGSGATDPDAGGAITYYWTLTSDPGLDPDMVPPPPANPATVPAPASNNPMTATVNQWGQHEFTLWARDPNNGVTACSTPTRLQANLVCPAGETQNLITCVYDWPQHACGSGGFIGSSIFEGLQTVARTPVNQKLACCLNGYANVNPGTNNCE